MKEMIQPLRKLFWPLLTCMFFSVAASAQDLTFPLGGNAMAASRSVGVPVNNYTGIPAISYPLYSYSGSSGLSFNISMDFFGGGIKTHEQGSSLGLGWNLNVGGGVISRNIRGIADDILGWGFLYTPHTYKEDGRQFINEYGNACLDAEQDVFQYNVNGRTGSFYIGRNKQILTEPGSHVKFTVEMDPESDVYPVGEQIAGIHSFSMTTDDGMKYIFDNVEYQTSYANVCGPSISQFKITYGSAWYVSKIVAPYSTDTISLSYISHTSSQMSISPQRHTINTSSVHQHIDTVTPGKIYRGDTVAVRLPLKISFPDSTKIDFVYNLEYMIPATLNHIRVSDTEFRYGYLFKYDTAIVNPIERRRLMGVNYYTTNHVAPGYTFTYNGVQIKPADALDTYNYKNAYKKDHWGYYNGLNTVNSLNIVPTVAGLYTGADRTVNANATAGTLASVTDPSGGITYYNFENNDILPVTNSLQTYSVDASLVSSVPVTMNRAQSILYNFKISFNRTFYRGGTPPVSGPGYAVFSITNSAGTITYYTENINLRHLYYNGSAMLSCPLANGSYLMKVSLASGTTASSSLPIDISYYNQAATGANSALAGGVRIKQITHFDPLYNKTDTLVTYKYVTADGKSSGMGGQPPVYDFITYAISGTTTITASPSHTNIVSDPANFSSFAEPSFVGYKRVEVIKGSLAHHLGQQVYEYTGAEEGYINTDPATFPYFPQQAKNWAAGLPKRILTYDSLNILVQKTTNTYSMSALTSAIDSNYRSIKHTLISGTSPSGTGLAKVKFYTGTFYYPQLGIPLLSATTDTFYHTNGSASTSRQQMEYDASFNVKKIISDYDRSLGLSLEKRIYYTYDYTITIAGLGKLKTDGIVLPISSESWITGDNNPRMVAANATWFSAMGLGRAAIPKATSQFVFQSNKPVPLASVGAFDPTFIGRNNSYFIAKDSMTWDRTLSLYTESIDKQTGFANSVMTGYNKRWPIAKVSNAVYTDIAYNSFETADAGNWTLPAYTAYTASSVTGYASFPLSAGMISKSALQSTANYYLSYWAKSGSSVAVSSGTPVLVDAQNGWDFYTLKFTGATSIYIYGTGWIDELRLHPQDANMVTYTYNTLGQVTATCDANNTIVYNFYDSLNRIKLIRDKNLNIIKKFEYPGNVLKTSTSPLWAVAYPTYFDCEKDANYQNTGRRLQVLIDRNYYSPTYLTTKSVVYDTNPGSCPLPAQDCGDPRYKWLNSTCEKACKEYISSIYQRVTDPYTGFQVYKWVSTFHYKWSDNSTSVNFTENSDNAHALGTFCVY